MTATSTPLWAMAVVLLCSVLASAGQAFFKLGSEKVSLNPRQLVQNWHLGLGLLLYAVATVIFIFTLRHGRLGTLYPVMAMSYIWVFLISWIGFREFSDHSPALNMAGLVFILAGCFLVTIGR